MKHLIFILTLVLAVSLSAFGQSSVVQPGAFVADDAMLVSPSHSTSTGFVTNFTSTSDDSSAYITASNGGIGTKIGLCREVYLVAVATDSVAIDVTLRLRNASLTTQTTTYTDSVVGTSNTNNIKIITLKNASTNRLTFYDEVKWIADYRASGNGTTTGRTMKWYLWYVR